MILIPGSKTFSGAKKWLFVVSDSMQDANGNTLGMSFLFHFVKSALPLLVNEVANPQFPLLSRFAVAEIQSLETIRKAVQPVLEALQPIVASERIIMAFMVMPASSSRQTITLQNADLSASALAVLAPDYANANENSNSNSNSNDVSEAIAISDANDTIDANHFDGAAEATVRVTRFEGTEIRAIAFAPNVADANDFGLSELGNKFIRDANYNLLPLFLTATDLDGDGSSDTNAELKELQDGNQLAIARLHRFHIPCRNYLSVDPASGQPKLDVDARGRNPQIDCPKIDPSRGGGRLTQSGHLDIWVAIPHSLDAKNPQAAIFHDGFHRENAGYLRLANAMAKRGIALFGVDGYGMGDRASVDANGTTAGLTPLFDGRRPQRSADFVIQSALDIYQLSVFIKSNPIVLSVFDLRSELPSLLSKIAGGGRSASSALSSAKPTLHFVGSSYGALVGSMIAVAAQAPIKRYVLASVGASLASILVDGGDPPIYGGATTLWGDMGDYLPTRLEALTFLGHTWQQAQIDALGLIQVKDSSEILLAQIEGDPLVPVVNRQLLSLATATWKAELPGMNNGNNSETLNDDEGVSENSANNNNASDSHKRWAFLLNPDQVPGFLAGEPIVKDFIGNDNGQAGCYLRAVVANFLVSGQQVDIHDDSDPNALVLREDCP